MRMSAHLGQDGDPRAGDAQRGVTQLLLRRHVPTEPRNLE